MPEIKKKKTHVEKTKLLFCGEFLVIALIALVIGILKLTNVIQTKPNRLFIYNIITLAGGAWFIFDLCWSLISKKRRAKVSLFDKITMAPISGYLIAFDIVCFIAKANDTTPDDLFIRISIGSVLLYVGALYIFQGFYRYNHPTPQLLDVLKEAEALDKEEEKEASGASNEENNTQEKEINTQEEQK